MWFRTVQKRNDLDSRHASHICLVCVVLVKESVNVFVSVFSECVYVWVIKNIRFKNIVYTYTIYVGGFGFVLYMRVCYDLWVSHVWCGANLLVDQSYVTPTHTHTHILLHTIIQIQCLHLTGLL